MTCSRPTLYIVGTPLDDRLSLSHAAETTCDKASLIVGESRKITMRFLKTVRPPPEKCFFLDPWRKQEWEALKDALSALGASDSVALLSDGGMPILFDPGKEVLDFCRQKNFLIRTLAGPTSWATACVVSGWYPPYKLIGFLPKGEAERRRVLKSLKRDTSHSVLLETPYRLKRLVRDVLDTWGPKHPIFFSWEISTPQEWYFWGTVTKLQSQLKQNSMEKGEFILIIHGASG